MDADQEDVAAAIAELLHATAQSLTQFGTAEPEGHAMLGDLVAKMRRQRRKVEQSLDGPPEIHAAHVRALSQGMRLCMARLEALD